MEWSLIVFLIYFYTPTITHIGGMEGHPSVLSWNHVTPGQVKGELENIGGGVREGVMKGPGDTG